MSTMPLPAQPTDDQVLDLWLFHVGPAMNEPGIQAAYEALVSPQEATRYRSFVFEKHRLLFLATRATVRTVLSHYAALPPQAWRFERGPAGKPHLSHAPPCGPLHFNLSNTAGLVVCAVSRAHERIGVDVETIRDTTDLGGIAERHFSPKELTAWHHLSAQDQEAAFYRYWTLKESFIKATGHGLSMPLDQIGFDLGGRPRPLAYNIRVELGASLQAQEDPSRWRFAQWRLREGHVIAVAADTAGAALQCRWRRAAPLLPGHGEPLTDAAALG